MPRWLTPSMEYSRQYAFHSTLSQPTWPHFLAIQTKTFEWHSNGFKPISLVHAAWATNGLCACDNCWKTEIWSKRWSGEDVKNIQNGTGSRKMRISTRFSLHNTHPLDLQSPHPQPAGNVSLISSHGSHEALFSIISGALRGKCCFCNFQTMLMGLVVKKGSSGLVNRGFLIWKAQPREHLII